MQKRSLSAKMPEKLTLGFRIGRRTHFAGCFTSLHQANTHIGRLAFRAVLQKEVSKDDGVRI